MASDFQIEDLVFQNERLVVYRAQASDGSALSLIRLCYQDGIIARLKSGRFAHALQELHQRCPLITGGLDPIDSYPWLALPWQDIQSNKAPNFETLSDTFSIDFHDWFLSFAQGTHPSQNPPASASPISTQSTFPTKIALLISALIICIGGGTWFIVQKKNPIPETASQASTSTPPPALAAQTVEEKKPLTMTIDGEIERPERPFIQHIKKIRANDPSALKANIGKWVALSGEISGIDKSGKLVFSDSTISAELFDLAPTAATGLVNKEVTLTGWLSPNALIEVEKLDDLEIESPPAEQEIFTVSDELYLRKMKGELITLEAQIVGISTSTSKKTLYLLLHKGAPPFSINILRSRLKSGLTSNFLHSLIGKKVHYRGKIGIGSGKGKSKRLSIAISKRAQITIVE